MNHYTVTVGSKVVAAFHQVWAAHNFVRKVLSPNCKPVVKKSRYTSERVTAKHCSNEARQVTNRVGNYENYPRPLKRGDFVL